MKYETICNTHIVNNKFLMKLKIFEITFIFGVLSCLKLINGSISQ